MSRYPRFDVHAWAGGAPLLGSRASWRSDATLLFLSLSNVFTWAGWAQLTCSGIGASHRSPVDLVPSGLHWCMSGLQNLQLVPLNLPASVTASNMSGPRTVLQFSCGLLPPGPLTLDLYQVNLVPVFFCLLVWPCCLWGSTSHNPQLLTYFLTACSTPLRTLWTNLNCTFALIILYWRACVYITGTIKADEVVTNCTRNLFLQCNNIWWCRQFFSLNHSI